MKKIKRNRQVALALMAQIGQLENARIEKFPRTDGTRKNAIFAAYNALDVIGVLEADEDELKDVERTHNRIMADLKPDAHTLALCFAARAILETSKKKSKQDMKAAKKWMIRSVDPSYKDVPLPDI